MCTVFVSVLNLVSFHSYNLLYSLYCFYFVSFPFNKSRHCIVILVFLVVFRGFGLILLVWTFLGRRYHLDYHRLGDLPGGMEPSGSSLSALINRLLLVLAI